MVVLQGSASICHPLDFLKTRMQLSGYGKKVKEHQTVFHLARHVFLNEGILTFYDGLSASLMRQISYTSVRTGVFTSLLDAFSKNGTPPGIFTKMGIGVVTGIAGALVGNPFDVALIRMAADGRLPSSERRNYKHVGDALYRMVAEEGIKSLFRGVVPNMARAIVVSITSFVTYLEIKEFLVDKGYMNDNLASHSVSSMISGLVVSVASLPIDAVKTRLQNMKTIDGVPEYTGLLDAGTKIIQKEGLHALFKGLTPYYLRLGPNTIFYFIFLEELTILYKKHVLGDTSGTGL
ncbi:mitochondrial 2-oxoglutarate/malate carrier protein-like isoform X2 [Periplaneta americana]|uniref:mitochondrial 2-oxoglutarate/malate carrier protein-like isoform X2 n=1 Tax=Periplaneta americana TaxID=6978 RepID=UPI0037E92F0E